MSRIFLIAAIFIVVISGCAYRFDAAELEYMEFQESTDITDWDAGIFEKSHIINFDNTENDVLAENITAIVNKLGLQLGVYHRNESCNISDRAAGLAIIKYKVGTITIQEDFCDPHSTANQAYLMIKNLDFY